MKHAATRAIAALAKEPPTANVLAADPDLVFGRDYLIPKPFDRRLLPAVAGAVAEAAMRTGMARRDIDLESYRAGLARLRSQGP